MRTWEQLRDEMVVEQLQARGIQDVRVLQAMKIVRRHAFIPELYRQHAYADEPLPIGAHQTISQPYMVAAMAEALALTGEEKLLEVGTGSGYAAAVMALLAAHVFTIECEPELAEVARSNLARSGYADRVTVIEGNGSLGYPPAAPFQAISVAAGAPDVPSPLLEQLDESGGRLVIPVGSVQDQELRLIRKTGDRIETRVVTYCRFVPLHGEQGWKG